MPAERREPLSALLRALAAAQSVVLTTHVNADGDGAGSQAAIAAWLGERGSRVRIVNPTPFPDEYRFLLAEPDVLGDPADPEVQRQLDSADLLLVVDTGEPRRVGKLEKRLRTVPLGILDHHPPTEGGIQGVGLVDPAAAAAGELVYDLLVLAEESGDRPWSPSVVEGIYTALVTDTGSFRYANTTPRVHEITADLLRLGVDPERLYRRIYASVPLSQIRLLARALQTLESDPELPLTWISVAWKDVRDTGANTRDFDGLVEHARSVEGTEVALLFREVADGSTKISFRSNGDADVSAIARQFGGGGHVKASGAVLGVPLEAARERVLSAAREALRRAGAGRGEASETA